MKKYGFSGFVRQAGNSLLALVCLFSITVQAQSTIGVQANFTRNNTVQEASEVASNVLRVVNYTSKPQQITIVHSLPSGWQLLGASEREVQLQPGDSVFVPLRVIPDKLSKGGTNYIITVLLESKDGVRFAAQNWYVGIRGFSNWKAMVPQRHVYFTNHSDSSGFRVHLVNDGNTDESIRLTLVPERHLELTDPGSGQPAVLSNVVPLPVGSDTTLTFGVRRRFDKNAYAGKKDGSALKSISRENYPVQVLARSTSGQNNQSWTSTVQFEQLGNRMQRNPFNRTALPLVLEANVYDVLSDGTTMALDAYGSAHLSEDEFLNYRFQTVFVNNFLNENTYLGTNHYIGYFSQTLTAEIGEINGWGRSLLTGKGLKSSYTYGSNTLGAMYVRNPGFFKDNTREGYGFYHQLHLKTLTWSNYYSHQQNSPLGITSGLYNSTAAIRISPRHQVTTGGGFSRENYAFALPGTPGASTGYGYDLNYSGSFNRFNFNAGTMYGSESYSLFRGVRMYTTRTSYRFNFKHSLGLTTQNFTQRPTYYVNGALQRGNYILNDRYELRWGIQTPQAILYVKPTWLLEENLSIHVRTAGSGFEYSTRSSGPMRFSGNLFMGYAHPSGYNLPDFFLSRLTMYFRWSRFYMNMRYFYGPNQLAEQLRFVKDRINPQTLNITASHDYWFGEGKFLLTTLTDLRYETYFKKTTFRLRPELFYYSNSGFRFSVYASFLDNSQKANPLLDDLQGRGAYQPVTAEELNVGFGLRKEIGIPVPGKKFCSVRVVVFKDLNGNGRQDANEEGVENMLVNIRSKADPGSPVEKKETGRQSGEDFITDQKGEILYENIPPGVYTLTATSLIAEGEWFDSGSLEIMVDKRQVVYLPLGRGTKLNGSLLILRDKYSSDEEVLDVARIRITAVDSSGKAYSTLTDRNGEFSLYLPMGTYTLTINEAALGSKYVFIQNRIAVDLTHPMDNYQVTFNAVEKKRKMEIKKFNNKGEEIK